MGNTIIPPLTPQEPQINRAGVAQTQPPTTILDLLAMPRPVVQEEEDLNPLNATGYGASVARESAVFSGEWLRNQAGRAARSFGDASINAVRGLTALAGGPAAEMALKVLPEVDTLDFLQMMTSPDPRLGDLAQVTRELQTERLGQTEIAGEAVGTFLSYATPTGPVGIAGKAGGMVGKAALAPAEKWAVRQLARKLIDPERVAQLRASGSLLTEVAKAGEWGSIGRAAMWGGQRIVNHAPAYTALLAQSYASVSDDERAASLGHTALLGPLMLAIGRAGQWAGNRVAGLTLSKESKAALLEAEEALAAGLKNPTTRGRKWLQRLQFLPANATASMFEGAGFSLLDPETLGLIQQYAGGDADAGRKLFWKVAATSAGVLVTKHLVPHDAVPYFRRIYPELNDLRLQKDAARRKRYAEQQESVLQWSAEAREQRERATEQEFREFRDEAVEDPHGEMMVAATRPLHRSGWNARQSDVESIEPSITYEFGTHSFEVKTSISAEQPSLQVVVPARTWNEIQRAKAASPESRSEVLADPAQPKTEQYEDASSREAQITKDPVTLSGLEAARFIETASLVGATRRMQAELDLSLLGNREVEAGGLWMGPFGAVQVDLDRSLLRHNLDGTKTPLPEVQLGGWAQGPGQPQYSSDKMIEIARIVAGKSQGWPEPIQDQAATAAITLGVFGQKTPSAQEVRLFVEGLPFDPTNPTTSPLMQRILTPDGMRRFAHELAMLGSGNSNYVDSLARMRRWAEQGPLQPDQPRQLEFTGERTPQPSETLADYLAEERMNWEGPARTEPVATVAAEKPVGMEPSRPPAQEAKTPPAAPEVDRVASYLDEAMRREPQALKPADIKRVAVQTAKDLGIKPSEAIDAIQSWAKRQVEAREETVRLNRQNQSGLLDVFRKPEPLGVGVRRRNPMTENVIARAVRYVTQDIPDVVRTAGGGGPVQQRAGRDLSRAFDEAKAIRGRHIDLERQTLESIRDAREHLDEAVVGLEGALYPRWDMALEGRGQVEGRAANEAVDSAQKLTNTYWKEARAAKVLRVKDGEWQELESGREGKVRVRLRGQDFDKVVNNEALLAEYSKAVAAENRAAGMEITPEQVAGKLRDSAWSPGEFTGHEREAAFEFVRTLRRMPPLFRDSTGKVWKVLEHEFGPYVERLAASQSDRIAAIKHFGQSGVPKEVRERFGIEREGLDERLKEYARAAGPDAADVLEGSVARLHGMGDKRDLWSPIDRLEGMRRGIETATAGLYDVQDIGVIQGFGPLGPFLRAFGKAARHPIETYRDMQRLGAIAVDRATTDLTSDRGFFEKIRDLATTFSRFTEGVKQTLTAKYGKEMADGMRAGTERNSARLRETLELFFPEKDRVDAMLRGEGTQAEYDRFVREFTKGATGQKRRGEGSQMHGSRNWNRIFGYWRHFMSRSYTFMRLMGRMYGSVSDLRAGRPGAGRQVIAAAHNVLQFSTRSIAAGMVSQLIGQIVREGWEAGTERWWRELLHDLAESPASTLATAFGTQVVGGPVMSALRTTNQPGKSALDIIGAAVMPVRVAAEMISAAAGLGPSYAGESGPERLLTYAERAPLIPKIVTTGTKAALATANAVDRGTLNAMSQLNAFLQQKGRAPSSINVDPESAPLYFANKDVRRVIQEHSDESPEQLLARTEPLVRESLRLGTGENLANSLLGARRLSGSNGLSPTERMEFAEFAGKKAMAKLYQYDRALELVANHYREQPGTDSNKTPFERRLQAVEQQAMEFGAEDLWAKMRDEVLDRAATAILDGDGLPSDEWEQLAVAMSRHPETLDRVLSPREFVMVNSVTRAEAGLLTEAIMLRALGNRVRGRIAAEKREMRESAFMEMLK